MKLLSFRKGYEVKATDFSEEISEWNIWELVNFAEKSLNTWSNFNNQNQKNASKVLISKPPHSNFPKIHPWQREYRANTNLWNLCKWLNWEYAKKNHICIIHVKRNLNKIYKKMRMPQIRKIILFAHSFLINRPCGILNELVSWDLIKFSLA